MVAKFGGWLTEGLAGWLDGGLDWVADKICTWPIYRRVGWGTKTRHKNTAHPEKQHGGKCRNRARQVKTRQNRAKQVE